MRRGISGGTSVVVCVAACVLLASPAGALEPEAAPDTVITGVWEITPTGVGGGLWMLTVEEDGSAAFQGMLRAGGGVAPVEQGRRVRDRIHFRVRFETHQHGGMLAMEFDGRLDGDRIRGEINGLPSGTVSFSGRRREGSLPRF